LILINLKYWGLFFRDKSKGIDQKQKAKGKSQKGKAKRVEQAAYFNLNLYYPQEWHL